MDLVAKNTRNPKPGFIPISMDTLPCEIISAIFLLLPIKLIVQCRGVCKTWRSIVDSPDFADTHLASTTTSTQQGEINPTFIFFHNMGRSLYIAQADQVFPNSHMITTRKTHVSFTNSALFLVGSCNGLVCLSSFRFDKSREFDCFVYICNPCRGSSLILPKFSSPECDLAHLRLGFGEDPLSKEYKVVQVFNGMGWCDDSFIKQEVQVYTLGSNTWRKIGYAPELDFFGRKSAFVNGSCHWLAKDEREDGVKSIVIVAFDLGVEEFRVIPSPEFSPRTYFDSYEFSIGVLGGCLSLVDCSFEDHHFEIWIMKDYKMKESWTKYIVTRSYDMHWWHYGSFIPISIWKNGEILLLYDMEKLVSYNPKSRSLIPLEVVGFPEYESSTCFEAFSYVRSLIPTHRSLSY